MLDVARVMNLPRLPSSRFSTIAILSPFLLSGAMDAWVFATDFAHVNDHVLVALNFNFSPLVLIYGLGAVILFALQRNLAVAVAVAALFPVARATCCVVGFMLGPGIET